MRIWKNKGRNKVSGGKKWQGITGAAFALIEVMVACGVLGILIVSLYAAFSFGFAVVRVNQENVRADQILLERLETLRIYNWSKVTSGTFFPTNFTVPFVNDSGSTGVVYNGTISISNAPITESYSNKLRQVTVGVFWLSGKLVRNRSMTTFVSENGIATYKP